MTKLYLKGFPKILACKNFLEEEKQIVGMRKYKEFCVFEWVRFCFDDIQDKRKKRFWSKMLRKHLFYKHFLMIHFLTRFLPLCKQMGYPFLVLKLSNHSLKNQLKIEKKYRKFLTKHRKEILIFWGGLKCKIQSIWTNLYKAKWTEFL